MQLVINISKKKYNEIKERTIITCGETFAKDLIRRIKNGTPLPDHHGRLIDADKLESHDEYDGQGFTKSVYKDDIDSLPTIIEGE